MCVDHCHVSVLLLSVCCAVLWLPGAAAAGGAAGRQRSAFWRGTLYIDQGQQGHPGQQGLQYMPLAEVRQRSISGGHTGAQCMLSHAVLAGVSCQDTALCCSLVSIPVGLVGALTYCCVACVLQCISRGRAAAQVELLSSNAAAMATHFSNRGNQIVSNRLLNLAEFKQLTSNRGPSVKVSRGSFKVVAPLNYWSWLQVRGLGACVWGSRLRLRRAGMQACGAHM